MESNSGGFAAIFVLLVILMYITVMGFSYYSENYYTDAAILGIKEESDTEYIVKIEYHDKENELRTYSFRISESDYNNYNKKESIRIHITPDGDIEPILTESGVNDDD